MEYFKLNNGTQMPMAGIGVFTFTPAEAQAAIESALRDGIRLIDTANAYQNEKATGRAMKASGVKREDIYLVTKLWPSAGYRLHRSAVPASAYGQLAGGLSEH